MPKKKIKTAYPEEDGGDSDDSSQLSCLDIDENNDNIYEEIVDEELPVDIDTLEPFEEMFKKRIRSAFPKPLQILGEKNVNTLEQVFDKNNKMQIFKIPRKYNTRISTLPSSQPQVECNKLCRSLLMSKPCSFGINCKFAHSFASLSKCKFDFCKKTKLIGTGVFKNVASCPCTLRHNMETMDSFIFRNRENTFFSIRLEIFKQYLEDFKEMIQLPLKCSKLELSVI